MKARIIWDGKTTCTMHRVVISGETIDDETNRTRRIYFVTQVYLDGSNHLTCEAHFYDAPGRQRDVQNWRRLEQLAQIVEQRLEATKSDAS